MDKVDWKVIQVSHTESHSKSQSENHLERNFDNYLEIHSESHVNISHLVCELIRSSVKEDVEGVRSLRRSWQEVQSVAVGGHHLQITLS